MDCFQCGLASIHAQEEGEGEGEGEDIPMSEFDFDMSKFPGEVEATAPYQEFLEVKSHRVVCVPLTPLPLSCSPSYAASLFFPRGSSASWASTLVKVLGCWRT